MFKTRWFVTPVILFTLVYNIPKFFELELVYPPADEIDCTGNQTKCHENYNINQVELKPTHMRINRVKKITYFFRKLTRSTQNRKKYKVRLCEKTGLKTAMI